VLYEPERRSIDLGHLLCTPRLWLGNDELVNFAPLEPAQRDSRRRRNVSASWIRRSEAYIATDSQRDAITELLRHQEVSLIDLHSASLLLASTEESDALAAIRSLEHVLRLDQAEMTEHALRILRRAVLAQSAAVQRRAFQVLAVNESTQLYGSTITTFLDRGGDVLDPETISVIADRDLSPAQVDAFIDEAERRCQNSTEVIDPVLPHLCELLSSYGSTHPSQYRRLRAFFTRAVMIAHSDAARELAAEGKRVMAQGFRQWLGTPSKIAVDPETGLEYRWEDVVEFSDEVDASTRELLLRVFRTTPIIREASFLFGVTPAAIHLDDILPGGVWVRLLGTSHGKSVFRVATRTRERGQLDLALNLNRDLPLDQVEEEINWLIVCSETRELGPLVEIFGGAWLEHGLWTEEFIPGETLDHAVNRLARRPEEAARLASWWPFAAWAAVSSYVDFWNRTDRRLVVADPSPSNVIVPMHDYHTGARLVSISSRAPFDSVPTMLRNISAHFISAVEADHPQLAGLAGWDVLFSAFLEIVGEQDGAARLRAILERGAPEDHDMVEDLRGFLQSVAQRGFLPRRLFFASKRYRKWERLNPEATHTARAATLQEIFETYGLADLRSTYPEVRARFFRETVFRTASEHLVNGLEDLIAKLRSGQLASDELSAAVSDLRAHLSLDRTEDYFLARLSYPYLRPEDSVEFVAAATGGTNQSEMVVTLEDSEGAPYRIRHALNPKEVGRLHRLFLAAKLQVQFRPEHRFLVALNERGTLIGGLFYEEDPESQTAHMDKIVVSNGFQGRGIAAALMAELGNRLRTAGYTSLTTGFFRPQFFYRMGFTVEKRYAGLYRSLIDEPGADG
jgi:GNAT superfamily N-acetyltransferase